MKKKYIIFFSIIVLIILFGIVASVIKGSKSLAANKPASVALYTIPDNEKVFINGVITPENSENIFLDGTKGNVASVSVTNEQVVKKGDTLFTYKNDQITDQITQLNTQITSANNQKKQLSDKQAQAKKLLADQQAQINNQTLQSAVDNNSVMAASQTDGIQSQISGYQDQIDSLQNQINSDDDQIKSLKQKETFTVNAPIDGQVLLNDSEKDPSKPFIVIESTSYYIKGTTNEKDLPKLKVNQAADILIFSTNKTVTGKVTSIGNRPAAPEVTAQAAVGGGTGNISYYDVDIALDSQENLTDGFHVQATINLSAGDIKIPKTAIFEENGKKYVYKVADKKLIKQEITCEDSTSDNVVVHSGLKENDSVAANANSAKEGMTVE